MKVVVAGKDRAQDLGREITAWADALAQQKTVPFLSPHHSALSLKSARNEREFLELFTNLARMRHGVRTGDFYIPARPGWKGRVMAWLKTMMWRKLRYQHDRIAFQQNLVNELNVQALERQNAVLTQEIEQLRRRVEQLEKAGPKK